MLASYGSRQILSKTKKSMLKNFVRNFPYIETDRLDIIFGIHQLKDISNSPKPGFFTKMSFSAQIFMFLVGGRLQFSLFLSYYNVLKSD